MIKKMRYQFILVTMASISFIFILILTVINISMTLSSRKQGYDLLYHMAEIHQNQNPSAQDKGNPHNTPPRNPVDGFDRFRSFSVLYDADGNISEIFYNENSDLAEDTIRQLAAEIDLQETPNEKGVLSKYLYIIKERGTNKQIFFLDYSMEKEISLRLFWTCLYIGLIGMVFIFLLVVILSKWIVTPVQTAFDKQKQFIADASHELKTPLTIITANAEVLAGTVKDNKWLNHILAQTRRMNFLIKNLLELAKLDSCDIPHELMDFDMSQCVKNAALSFESLAFEYGKTYEIDICNNIYMYGNESAIRQLTTILLDNAFKYSEEKGSISIHLCQQGDKRILTVQNSGNIIPKQEQKRIFERFYRSDSSRSRETGGYGLGDRKSVV